MDIQALRNHIQSLLKDDTSPEDAQEIGALLQEVDTIEKEHNELVASQEQLRTKYIESLKQSSFEKQPQDLQEQKVVTFEDCVQKVIKERG